MTYKVHDDFKHMVIDCDTGMVVAQAFNYFNLSAHDKKIGLNAVDSFEETYAMAQRIVDALNGDKP